jgi:hypothetical protein
MRRHENQARRECDGGREVRRLEGLMLLKAAADVVLTLALGAAAVVVHRLRFGRESPCLALRILFWKTQPRCDILLI